jgi:hypothetical protein
MCPVGDIASWSQLAVNRRLDPVAGHVPVAPVSVCSEGNTHQSVALIASMDHRISPFADSCATRLPHFLGAARKSLLGRLLVYGSRRPSFGLGFPVEEGGIALGLWKLIARRR